MMKIWAIYAFLTSISFDKSSSLYRISRMGGGYLPVPNGGGVLFYIGEIKNFAFFQTRKV